MGIITSSFGFIYVLGISNRIEYTYAFGIGFILITLSVLIRTLANFSNKIALMVSIGAMVRFSIKKTKYR